MRRGLRREAPTADGEIGPRSTRALGVVVLLLGLFVLLSVFVRTFPDNASDAAVLDWVRRWEAPFVDEFMAFISRLTAIGPRMVLTVLAIGAIYLVGPRHRAFSIALAAGIVIGPVLALDHVAGLFVGRIRPNGAPFLSFPSGHVLGSLIQFGFAAYIAAMVPIRWPLRVPLVAVLLVPVVASGPSRLFLGVHWPSDILGAYLLGAASLLVLIVIDDRLQRHLNRR